MAGKLATINLPGKVTRVGWQLPKAMSFEDWIDCGKSLDLVEGAVQWWRGDWWAYAMDPKRGCQWGEGQEIAGKAGVDYGTIRTYASVSRAYELSSRLDNLTFEHHRSAMAADAEQRGWWLQKAVTDELSVNQLRAAIKHGSAFDRTKKTELEAEKIGKFVVLYADPPWRYENPPMGGSNRSIENHYPTMELEDICALPVSQIANDDCVLFLWATSPKLYECMKVLDAWGFVYRTDMVWVKDQIGMGYHVRGKHESLLIAKRGELPPPAAENRPDSVVEAPRTEHSAKPPVFYDILDRMYPKVRKVELFARGSVDRPLWFVWGNQATTREAAE